MKKPCIVMRLITTADTSAGTLSYIDNDIGRLGVMDVYESKKAARAIWGKNVVLTEIEPLKAKEGQ